MRKWIGLLVLTGSLGFVACDTFGQAMTAHTNLVARAGGHELTIDKAASWLASHDQLPAQREVVDALANLWVDYTLLAMAATEDPTLESIDVESVIRPEVEQQLVFKLRDEVIQADTTFSEGELRELYTEEQPDLRVRARHILLRLPADASPEQRDSVMAVAEELRRQAAEGADFAALAREHSEDPGSAEDGGDLGLFGRGDMVGPFEEVAFSLDVGAVSDVVETPFGFHIIKLLDRELPEFEDVRERFRQQMAVQRQLDAENEYIEGVTEPQEITVRDDAYEVARELAGSPTQELSGRARSRSLVAYRDGEVTASEYLDFMRRMAPSQRARYASATDEQLEQVLTALARNEILVSEARRRVQDLSPEQRDSLENDARRQLQTAMSAAGLHEIEPQADETEAEAIERKVEAFMTAVLAGEREVLPLGSIAYALRARYRAEVFQRAIPDVLDRARALRGGEQQLAPGVSRPAPNAPRPQQPDTAGQGS